MAEPTTGRSKRAAVLAAVLALGFGAGKLLTPGTNVERRVLPEGPDGGDPAGWVCQMESGIEVCHPTAALIAEVNQTNAIFAYGDSAPVVVQAHDAGPADAGRRSR